MTVIQWFRRKCNRLTTSKIYCICWFSVEQRSLDVSRWQVVLSAMPLEKSLGNSRHVDENLNIPCIRMKRTEILFYTNMRHVRSKGTARKYNGLFWSGHVMLHSAAYVSIDNIYCILRQHSTTQQMGLMSKTFCFVTCVLSSVRCQEIFTDPFAEDTITE